ncbi:MAG: sigma-54 dependent transcriptional regulator [Myxococcota bacterium]|nr:sigma-54 dependent transcriptional regulator [Myxococcota bacterium]
MNESSPPVLVIASDPERRAKLEKRVGQVRAVVSAYPRDLQDTDSYVDACAALFVLGSSSADQDLEGAAWLAALPASQSLALVRDGEPEDVLAEALCRLRPQQVVHFPLPDELLHWLLERVAPSGTGQTARDQHRPARALLGVSSAIRKVTEEIALVAPSRVPVLILGETGTGKELVARAIHEQSPRAERAFVAVNCGAIPESLLETELFGHCRGAFTGSISDRKGLFEKADGGTLFLDEIAEMSPALQVKLLRVLETGEVRPIGSNESVTVDVRIVSATHRDLEAGIEDGSFRQDLFYRLNTLTCSVPPLRRRRVDIPFLAQHFAEEFGRENATRISLGEDFLDSLSKRDFPGNVRELRNAVERAIALATPGKTLTAEDLPTAAHDRPALYAMGTLRDQVAQIEIQVIRDALDRFDGNKTRAAEAIGISRLALRNKMRRLGLE